MKRQDTKSPWMPPLLAPIELVELEDVTLDLEDVTVDLQSVTGGKGPTRTRRIEPDLGGKMLDRLALGLRFFRGTAKPPRG
jgi:hypothetical protein